MIRRLLLTGFMAIGLVGAPVAGAPVAAAARVHTQAISIVSTMTIPPVENNYGTFSTSPTGLVCRNGAVLDTAYNYVDVQWLSNGDALVTLDVNKTFTCPGGDQVLVLLEAHTYYPDPYNNNFIPTGETFTWSVLGGTGRFADLQGHGIGTTTFHVVDGVLQTATNYYWGMLQS